MKPAPKQVREGSKAADEAHARFYPPPPAEGLPPPVEPAPSVGPGNEPILYGYGSPPQPGEPGHPGFPPGKGPRVDAPTRVPATEPPATSAAPPAQPPAGAAAAPPVQPEPPVAPPPAEPEETVETLKHKLSTLQGKYNAETSTLRSRLEGLEGVLAVVQTAPVGVPALPEPGEGHDDKVARLREEFGDDFVDTVTAEAMRRIQPQFQKLQDGVAEYNNRLEAAKIESAQDAQKRMYFYMNDNVPGWQDTNASKEFQDWCNQVDILSGVRRIELLQNAYNANDGPRLAAFFLTFRQEQTVTGARPGPAGIPASPAPPRPGLETFAAPGRPAPGAPPPTSAPGGDIWTQADIRRFYRDKQRGVFRGRQAEADKIEQEIFAAGREGRVRD